MHSPIRSCLASLILAALHVSSAAAQLLQYPDPCLDYVYPAGAQQGKTVSVELGGFHGLAGAKEVLVEGPPGITVSEVKAVSAAVVTAKFEIAPDAAPGRRMLRLLGGTNGLTNARSFFVGTLPEILEIEPKEGEPQTPQEVQLPVVVNGRINPTLDVDTFHFSGKAGQKIVAAILAHRMDSIAKRLKSPGFLDTSLELTDKAGNVLATAEDTLGLDPVLFIALPADGEYIVRIKSLSFMGSIESIYRLTLGEVPYPTAVFPAGGKRGESVSIEFSGPNVPPGARRTIAIPSDDPFAVQDVSLDGASDGIQWLPFLRGDFPESTVASASTDRTSAPLLGNPSTVNGRFEKSGDENWFRVRLAAGEAVLFQTMAQRHLFSPVDTALEVYDAPGKKLAENDDGRRFASECLHDFASADSWLGFRPPQAGEFFVRIRDQAGAAGERAMYRLSVEPYRPDFQLLQWPDAVPIWGAGTTASFVVQLLAWGGMNSDVELTVEGLPAGWTAPAGHIPAATFATYSDTEYGIKALLTITAPADAAPFSLAEFRVRGKAVHDGRTIEHVAQPLSLLGNSHNDRMHLRHSRASRAVVAGPLDSRVETTARELTVEQGASVQIPVKLIRRPETKSQISITAEGQTVAASSAWQAPFALTAEQNDVLLPFKVSADRPPGTYSIVVSRSWASDLRGGRPGPCTPLITLHVKPPAK